MSHGFLVSIPVPPSVNGLYANSKSGGRHKTRAYRAWCEEAGWEIKRQKPVSVLGKYKFCLTLPKMPANADPDNRLKAALDLIVALKLVQDDSSRYCVSSTAEVDESRTGFALIAVEPVAALDTFISLGDAAGRVLRGLE